MMLKNGKRQRERGRGGHRRQSRLLFGEALSVGDVHDLAYWSQWRLAIHGVCARFEAAAQVEAEAWSRREELGHVDGAKFSIISNKQQQAVSSEAVRHLDGSTSKEPQARSSEVRHLEQQQLGRRTSVNAKLEAALSENAEALAKAESARAAAAAAVFRLQTQISHDKQTAAATTKKLEEKISLSAFAHRGLTERLQQAEAARLQAEANHAELLRDAARAEAELSEARLAAAKASEESRAEREAREALQAELAALREKYSALKRRFVDAGKKVEAVRGERDLLRQARASLEDKLADVEKFQGSKRGQALDRMEQDLATERMARVELEADRDDLQSQLAAALQAAGGR